MNAHATEAAEDIVNGGGSFRREFEGVVAFEWVLVKGIRQSGGFRERIRVRVWVGYEGTLVRGWFGWESDWVVVLGV